MFRNGKTSKSISNKKVLLRERKRHTDHRVAALSPDFPTGRVPSSSPDRWGTPIQSQRGGIPYQSQGGGTPSSPHGGYPHPVPTGGYAGLPPSVRKNWGTLIRKNGVAPLLGKDGGTPHQNLMGVPPCWRMGVTPHPKVEQTHTCENITSHHPSDAGGN